MVLRRVSGGIALLALLAFGGLALLPSAAGTSPAVSDGTRPAAPDSLPTPVDSTATDSLSARPVPGSPATALPDSAMQLGAAIPDSITPRVTAAPELDSLATDPLAATSDGEPLAAEPFEPAAEGLPTIEEADSLAFDFLASLPSRDLFGLLSAWEAQAADTSRIRVGRFAPQWHPLEDPLLQRISARLKSRRFVRDVLQLRPDYFASSDSIAVVVDARADTLIQERGVAEGLFYLSSRSSGIRLISPSGLPQLNPRSPVVTAHSVDLDAGLITRVKLWRSVETLRRVREPYADYLIRLIRRTSREIWQDEIKRVMQESTVEGGRAGLVRISLPFELPPAMKSIFGEGTPNLSVRGSERISFGGRSQWFPHRPTTEFQREPSKFPQLEMEQELNIQLKGTIGDKLDVDVDQASQSTTPLANKIKIHYRGYEDEIIQRVDLGNTSLNLPGTQYVSYGGRHTGLFGINAEAQLGDVTLNMILSKEEGQTSEKSTSIRSQQELKRIYDYEYIRNRFFFVDDPDHDAYPDDPNNVIDIDRTSVELWLDDGDGKTQELFATTPGIAVLGLGSARPTASDTVASDTLYFERLDLNQDYVLYIDERFEDDNYEVIPYIVLQRYIDERATLAVTFRDEYLGQDVGGLDGDLLYARMIRPKDELVSADMNAGDWGPTNKLMLKNIYSLHPGAGNWTEEGLPEASILKDGFEMSIHYKGTVGGAEDPDELEGVKVIRHTGLDSYEETDTGYQLGQDGRVDFGRWIDQGRGLIYFPDLEPFSPERLGKLRGRPGDSLSWHILPEEFRNSGIYDRKTSVRKRQVPGSDTTWTSRFYIEVKYRTPVTELRIDAWDIIEGSEVVTIGGRRLQKDRDYRIDYQTGIVHLYDEAEIGEDEQINITYKQASAFGMVSKSLLGGAARYAPEDSKFSFATSWLFQRTGSPDRRPRLGSEPTRIAVGEVSLGYDTESMLLTRLLDKLPLLDTRQASRLSFSGGVGLSFPNPNTRNDLYVDDFEGVADDIAVRLNRLAWKAASIPIAAPGDDESDQAAHRGELWWYTPYRALREGDLNPTLDYQEANDYRTVLELQAWPYSGPLDTLGIETCPPESSWVGITQNLARSSLDMTRARFLDIWINDFVNWETFLADTTTRSGTLYVELGRISEDALWQRRPIDCETKQISGGPIGAPNARLDSEDANNDGQLDLSDENDEDSGFDGTNEEDGAVSEYLDDYGFSGDAETTYSSDPELCTVYNEINGTEGNARLDSEDLDGDNSLSQESSYFQFKIDLADSSIVETDVSRDYEESEWQPGGWRRIRIPLSDAYVDDFVNNPSWDDVKQIRLWFAGLNPSASGPWPGRKRIQIAEIEIRSNRWVAALLRDTTGALVPTEEILANEEDFFPGVINNKENADVYDAPFEEHRERDRDNTREREQSLTMELRNFQPGHVGRAYMPFLRDQDYTGYEFLEFWLNGTLPAENDAEFFLRLCKETNADSTHYYEYRVPVPKIEEAGMVRGRWLPIKIRLSDLSDLKLSGEPDSVLVERELEGGARLRKKGHPYLTKIGRITLGVVNAGGTPIANANVWVDELRLTHVFKEVDYAWRVQLRADLSDIGKIDIGYKYVGADFSTISGGGFRARKEEQTNLTTSGSLALDRFTPSSWGLRLPLSAQYSHTRRVPKYRTNDDILVGEDPDDRDVTQSSNQNYSLSISRRATRHGLLKYTVDAFTISGSLRKTAGSNPTARDTSVTKTLSIGYSVPLGTWGSWNFYKGWKLRLLPTNFSMNMSRSWREEARYRRENADINQPYVLDDRRRVRSGALNIKTGLRPIQAITYSWNQSRDLMLSHHADWLSGLNIGRETSRQEDLTANYTLRTFGDWIEPRMSWRGGFRGAFNQQENVGGGDLERVANLTNSRTASVATDLPLSKLFGLLGSMTRGSDDEESEEDADREEERKERDADRRGSGVDGHSRRTVTSPTVSSGGGFLSHIVKLTRTTGSFSRTQQSTYNRVHGEPAIAYQLGLSMDPDVERLSSSRDTKTDGEIMRIEGDLKLLRNVGVGLKFERNSSETRATGTRSGKLETTWPELDLRWGDLSRKLGLKRYVKTMKTNTRLSRRSSETRQSGRTTRRQVNANWSPLLDMSLTLNSGVSLALRVDHTGTHSEDMSGVGRVTDRDNTRVKFSAKKSLDITREITVPLTGVKQRIKSRLDLGLTIKFDRNQSVSQQTGQKPQVMADLRSFDFALNGSYQFSKSVTGHARIELGESADSKNKTRTSRYVAVNLSAGFSF